MPSRRRRDTIAAFDASHADITPALMMPLRCRFDADCHDVIAADMRHAIMPLPAPLFSSFATIFMPLSLFTLSLPRHATTP